MKNLTKYEKMLVKARALDILRNCSYGKIMTMSEAIDRALTELHLR